MKLMRHIILPSFVRLSVCRFIKLFCACHILRTLHARVLKFYIWFSNEKIADPYFFPCPACLFRVMLLSKKKIRIKSCEQDILRSILAGFLKFDIVSGNDV